MLLCLLVYVIAAASTTILVFPVVFLAQNPALHPPHDILAIFEYELFYGGIVNINIYKENMYRQFPMVSVGHHHRVNSPQSNSQPRRGRTESPVGPEPLGGRKWSLLSPGALSMRRCYCGCLKFPRSRPQGWQCPEGPDRQLWAPASLISFIL